MIRLWRGAGGGQASHTHGCNVFELPLLPISLPHTDNSPRAPPESQGSPVKWLSTDRVYT